MSLLTVASILAVGAAAGARDVLNAWFGWAQAEGLVMLLLFTLFSVLIFGGVVTLISALVVDSVRDRLEETLRPFVEWLAPRLEPVSRLVLKYEPDRWRDARAQLAYRYDLSDAERHDGMRRVVDRARRAWARVRRREAGPARFS